MIFIMFCEFFIERRLLGDDRLARCAACASRGLAIPVIAGGAALYLGRLDQIQCTDGGAAPAPADPRERCARRPLLDRPLFKSEREGRPRHYLTIVGALSTALNRRGRDLHLRPRSLRRRGDDGQMLKTTALPVIFGAATPGPMRTVAIFVWRNFFAGNEARNGRSSSSTTSSSSSTRRSACSSCAAQMPSTRRAAVPGEPTQMIGVSSRGGKSACQGMYLGRERVRRSVHAMAIESQLLETIEAPAIAQNQRMPPGQAMLTSVRGSRRFRAWTKYRIPFQRLVGRKMCGASPVMLVESSMYWRNGATTCSAASGTRACLREGEEAEALRSSRPSRDRGAGRTCARRAASTPANRPRRRSRPRPRRAGARKAWIISIRAAHQPKKGRRDETRQRERLQRGDISSPMRDT